MNAAVVSLSSIIASQARARAFVPGLVDRDIARAEGRVLAFRPREKARGAPSCAGLDRVLIDQVARGSTVAMRALYLRHHLRVGRYVLRIVRDRTLAEDVMGEVFLDVWQHAHRFEGRSTVSTWICGIARHKALTALEANRREWFDDERLTSFADPAPDPEGVLAAKDKVAAVRRALSALSHEHREILDLVYYQEKSIKEIADVLGIALNTVKTRMFYARKRLAALLVEAGIAPARA